ncbi:MAG: hydantoinase B/oxoprolinase family protein, partial [Balneolaceae bacterium]
MKPDETQPDSWWNVHIDTGGTFTDCIARDPAGVEHRCKVLSSSALRGSCIEKSGPASIRCDLNSDLPDHFFNGFTFRWLQNPEESRNITGYHASGGVLHFREEINLPNSDHLAFEVLSPEEAPILAARIITGSPVQQPLPPIKMKLATTRGTNALLERNGARTLLLITRGFKDLLLIGNQQRPDLFSLDIHKALPFYEQILEVPERIDSKGNVRLPLDPDEVEETLEPYLQGIDSVAICLMNSYQNPVHEHKLKNYLENKGIRHLSVSSELSSLIKIVPRAQTTDVNAYLAPVMEEYLNRVSSSLSDDTLYIMNSAGNLTNKNLYAPKDSLLSGPAGGVTGAVSIGNRAGFQKIISFDMGGTSTDVARYNGQYDYLFEHSVGDATLQAPALSIETVASGGGSVCDFDGESLTVGPESAGAEPGPACYGAGGPLTLTDVNLLTGRLIRSNFHFPVQIDAAKEAFEKIYKRIQAKKGKGVGRQKILEGFLDIANERMAQAIVTISLEKGFDPARYCMVAFGGAGGQHATAVAGKLGIKTVLTPSDAGLLSAHGLDQSRLETIQTEQLLQPLDDVQDSLSKRFKNLENKARQKLADEGIEREQLILSRASIFARLLGQESTLELPFRDTGSIRRDFIELYRNTYGHRVKNKKIEIESIRVIVSEKKTSPPKTTLPPPTEPPEPFTTRELMTQDKIYSMPVYHRSTLPPGCKIDGPSLILDPYSTVLVEPGWSGRVYSDQTIELAADEKQERVSAQAGSASHSRPSSKEKNEVINLQLYTNRFGAIAEQMGEMLRRTALSVNVKERLDFSCALLDARGYLVVNAPHIPVHLGAMGLCVRTLMDSIEMEEGDVVITNHPGYGGSHLPDVTVVTPVYNRGERIGFVANRAHHAEIGGMSPGSMPPDAKNLSEEGVVIPPMHLMRSGRENWDKIRGLLENSPWPSRSVEENLTDLQAAVAANHRGVNELLNLAGQFGGAEVTRYMAKLREYASERMRQTLMRLDNGVYEAEERLDDDSTLNVYCKIEGDEMEIDFTGTNGVHPGNLNANPSIVNSVVIYVLRLLVDEPLPLNDGLLSPVTLHLPEGSMLNPPFPENPDDCPAVVGGNIETSQRLVDTFLKAFGLAACSQGTMNNVLFGNEQFGYYETVGGGTGAGNGFHGADAVHHHMTNTRATDPEVLEQRYPVRLDRYTIRQDSGGEGTWKGGNGLIREMTFLEPVRLSVLTQHRVVPPYGLHGGEPGKTGLQQVEKKDGTILDMKWKDGVELKAGDRFILETPGGGGYGAVNRD